VLHQSTLSSVTCVHASLSFVHFEFRFFIDCCPSSHALTNSYVAIVRKRENLGLCARDL
jgi:hypothetical protein